MLVREPAGGGSQASPASALQIRRSRLRSEVSVVTMSVFRIVHRSIKQPSNKCELKNYNKFNYVHAIYLESKRNLRRAIKQLLSIIGVPSRQNGEKLRLFVPTFEFAAEWLTARSH